MIVLINILKETYETLTSFSNFLFLLSHLNLQGNSIALLST